MPAAQQCPLPDAEPSPGKFHCALLARRHGPRNQNEGDNLVQKLIFWLVRACRWHSCCPFPGDYGTSRRQLSKEAKRFLMRPEGPAPGEHLLLQLKRPPAQEQALNQLIDQLQAISSATPTGKHSHMRRGGTCQRF
jgi:hypothetical protein